jgi:hypothetical protein
MRGEKSSAVPAGAAADVDHRQPVDRSQEKVEVALL